ncbi:hypothetical protein RINTHH_4350 [Richelia intracellularis HH01]|jgi:hypothetical protein|uniref:Uncharacterized protein n=2 Tax=Richelia TaxID=98443 RepID=M1X2C6_9NOST|nr:hypothetical protein RINTHH_4350 [Richelia intracellularis HH01]
MELLPITTQVLRKVTASFGSIYFASPLEILPQYSIIVLPLGQSQGQHVAP